VVRVPPLIWASDAPRRSARTCARAAAERPGPSQRQAVTRALIKNSEGLSKSAGRGRIWDAHEVRRHARALSQPLAYPPRARRRRRVRTSFETARSPESARGTTRRGRLRPGAGARSEGQCNLHIRFGRGLCRRIVSRAARGIRRACLRGWPPSAINQANVWLGVESANDRSTPK